MSENQERRQDRKQRVKPLYAFPSYNLGVALQVADKIERVGGGKLTEETLAVSLGVSAKSSGFRLRINNARQFGLVTKQGEYLSTTHTAKSILKPTASNEKADALRQAFLSIPLFKVVVSRFKGQPLPRGDSFRNVLEREFKIESARVRDAERVLLDSAREAGLITESGGNTYLVTEIVSTIQPSLFEGIIQREPVSSLSPRTTEPYVETARSAPPTDEFSSFSVEDISELNDDEFAQFWQAWGKIIRRRAMRQRPKEELETNDRQRVEETKEEE